MQDIVSQSAYDQVGAPLLERSDVVFKTNRSHNLASKPFAHWHCEGTMALGHRLTTILKIG